MPGNNLAVLFSVALLMVGLASCGQAHKPVQDQTQAKNIILMIGDGMGFKHSNAASLYLSGEAGLQPYHAFPVQAAMSTFAATGSYSPQHYWSHYAEAEKGATDSAAAATAMATGSKTYRYAVGVDTQRRDLVNIVELAEAQGRATGVVTSVQFSHATPAAFVAHNPTRRNYEEIARDMVEKSGLEVLMGCGHPWYDDSGNKRKQPDSYCYVGGQSTWLALYRGELGNDADRDGRPDPWVLIEDRAAFQKLATGNAPKRVIGIAPVARTLQQKRSAQSLKDDPTDSETAFSTPLIASVPSLAEMTRAALNVLDEDPDGFFLMVEGGAIDWASHANQTGRLIEEQIAFDQAIARVIAWVEQHSSWGETLLIVTADHECGFLNGPGPAGQPHPLVSSGPMRQPVLQWQAAGHTNSLVPLFAKGAGAEGFSAYFHPESDPVRGPYLDNTAIGLHLKALLRP